MTDRHEPDPRFVQQLEWQIETAVRRRNRFSKPASGRLNGTLRTVALIAVSLVTGAASVVATERLRADHETARVLAFKAETRIDLARGELAHAQERYDEVLQLVERGFASTALETEVELDVEAKRHALDRARLDYEEVLATGLAPSDNLAAPMPGTRDFVSERLQLAIDSQHVVLELHERELDRAKQLLEAGMLTRAAFAELANAMTVRQEDLAELEHRLRLRLMVLHEEVAPHRAILLDMLFGCERKLSAVDRRMRRLERQVLFDKEPTLEEQAQKLERLEDLGYAQSETEQQRANVEWTAKHERLQLERRVLEAERELLQKKLGLPGHTGDAPLTEKEALTLQKALKRSQR